MWGYMAQYCVMRMHVIRSIAGLKLKHPLVWHGFQQPGLKSLQGEPQHGRFIRRILVVGLNLTGFFLYGGRRAVMGDQQVSKQIRLSGGVTAVFFSLNMQFLPLFAFPSRAYGYILSAAA